MPKTLDSGPWEYLPVLNECITIMITISIGFLAARVKALEAEVFVPQAVKFVFTIALPFHIIRGIGIVVDFYDESFLWTYMSAFLVLRVIALVFSVGMVILKLGSRETGIGQVAVNWLCLSWISTVILGVPIAEAVFGNEAIGLKYGMFAGVSSFIFQLPLQLFFLECHLVERQAVEAKENDRATREADVENEVTSETPIPEQARHNEVASDAPSISNEYSQREEITAENEFNGLHIWVDLARRRDVWARITKQVITNPVVCGIAIGFFLSLSTIGPEYLNPTSPRFVPGLSFIWDTTRWLGECVSPVSLIAMGVWMEKQGRSLFRLPPISVFLYMLSKLLIVPLVMVGLAKAFDFNDEAGRAAILIAALPVSMAAFALGSHYNIGQNILSANVAIGTLLILPTILLWNIGLDAVDLYPIPESP